MFNRDFYPTPDNIIFIMTQAIGGIAYTRGCFLEPSAGGGNIIDYINRVARGKKIYTFEKDVQLQAIVKSKPNTVFLGDDFLAYTGSQRFDKIIMNPPFSEGDKHALKAWEVLESEGRMVCLLNAETLLNPHTKTRQILAELVQDFGTQEPLGKCFATGAERKTDVDVVMITLKKPKDEGRFDFSKAGFANGQSFQFGADFNIKDVATQNAITNLVAHYREAENALVQIVQSFDKLAYHLDVFGAGKGSLVIANIAKMIGELGSASSHEPMTALKNEVYNNALDLIRDKAWGYIDVRTGVGEQLTNEARTQFYKYMEAQKGVDFSEENIMTLFDYLVLNRDFLMQKAIEQTFEMMCKFHHKNKVASDSWKKENTEGFKTNSHYKVNQKVIIPHMISESWGGTPYIEWNNQQKLDEIDKVICHLFSTELKNIVTIHDAVDLETPHRKKEAIDSAKRRGFDFEADYKKRLLFNPENFEGAKMIGDKEANEDTKLWKNTTVTRARDNVAESTFFWCEYFKKGTLHLYFKHRIVWETFNRVACEGKMQLG